MGGEPPRSRYILAVLVRKEQEAEWLWGWYVAKVIISKPPLILSAMGIDVNSVKVPKH